MKAGDRALDTGGADGLSFGGVATEQGFTGAAIEDEGQLPRQVVGVGDGHVQAQAVGRWVTVHGVTHAEHVLTVGWSDQHDGRHDRAIEDQTENGDPQVWVTLLRLEVARQVARQRREDAKQDGKQR